MADDAKALATKYKEEGNAQMTAGHTLEAIDSYTKAIEQDPQNTIFYSNRSAAYFKLGKGEEALKDAEECLCLDPNFTKGFGRKANALLSLKRHKECIDVCKFGLVVDRGNKVLQESMKCAKKGYVGDRLVGSWVGTVSEALGGYEQVFEFVNDVEMKITVMGRTIDAKYNINIDHKPWWINMAMPVEEGPSNTWTPEVPYIFKFDRDVLADVLAETAPVASSSEKKEKKEKKKDKKEGGSDDAKEEKKEKDESLEAGELHLCCPYMAMDRPKKFDGPGLVCMKRVKPGDTTIATGARQIKPEIEALTRDQQVLMFCSQMVKLLPEKPLEEPTQFDSQDVAAQKVSRALRLQNEMMKLDHSFPEEVSTDVQEYIEGTKVPPLGEVTDAVDRLREKMKKMGMAPPGQRDAWQEEANKEKEKDRKKKKSDAKEETASKALANDVSEPLAKQEKGDKQSKKGKPWVKVGVTLAATVVVGAGLIALIQYMKTKAK